MKAIILMNMGGAESKAELKMFLTNMFNDKNIMTVNNRFLRALIAKMIVFSRLDGAGNIMKKLVENPQLTILQNLWLQNCKMNCLIFM